MPTKRSYVMYSDEVQVKYCGAACQISSLRDKILQMLICRFRIDRTVVKIYSEGNNMKFREQIAKKKRSGSWAIFGSYRVAGGEPPQQRLRDCQRYGWNCICAGLRQDLSASDSKRCNNEKGCSIYMYTEKKYCNKKCNSYVVTNIGKGAVQFLQICNNGKDSIRIYHD